MASYNSHYLMHMKITLISPALAAILGLALIGAPVTAQAQTTNSAPAMAPPPSTPAKAPKAAKTPYKGTITAVDATSVTVASTAKTLTLAITAKTKIQVDKKTATITDFAVGDSVTGSFSTDETGAMTAASLRKKTVKPAAAAPAATPAPAAAPATQ